MGHCDDEKCKSCEHKQKCEEIRKAGSFDEAMNLLGKVYEAKVPKMLLQNILHTSTDLFIHVRSHDNAEEFKKINAFLLKVINLYSTELNLKMDVDLIRDDKEGIIECRVKTVEKK